MPKPMRLPNGFGNINKLSGNRRNPYRARVFQGFADDGKKIYKNIGYYDKYDKALTALVEYHKNPLDFQEDVTFEEVYERWSDKKFPQISDSNVSGYKASYKLCSSLYKKPMREIKLSHLQFIADNCNKNYPTKKKLKVLFSQLFEYAVKNEIISKEKDITELLDIGSPEKSTKHYKFNNAEMDALWRWSPNNDYVQMILMMIYSGARPGEFLGVKKKFVNLEEQYIVITKGKNDLAERRIPIHSKMIPFYKNWMQKDGEYLITKHNGQAFNLKKDHNTFAESYWEQILSEIGILEYNTENGTVQKHQPHDVRHTFASMWREKKLDEAFRRKIQGHSGKGIGEQVYTHLDMEKLLDEINQL